MRTGLLQLIFEYTLMEDWVFPTINKYQPELLFYATVHRMQAELAEDAQIIAEQLAKQKAPQRAIRDLVEGQTDRATFRLEGLFCYKFHRRHDLAQQEYEARIRRKEMTYNDFEKMEPITSMNVIVNTEVFRAWARSTERRKIIEKLH